MTLIGALRHDRIEAPWVLDGPVNAEAFKTYVKAELLKTSEAGRHRRSRQSQQSQGQGGARQESTWFARSAVNDLVAPMRTPHLWIAAMSGFTPRMFMTRVRL